MQAAEAKIQKVLEGTKQFLVPHYQRPYSWTADQWKTLWRDVSELLEDPNAKPHFLGSIVTSPAKSVPEGVEKRLLIDGQQRLTTLLVLLTLIRDRARATGSTKLAEKIDDLVANRHEDGEDHYKLLPTQAEDPNESDREAFVRFVAATHTPTKSGIGAAYEFFASKLRRADAPNLDELYRAITSRLTLVSIILDDQDNPHRIFESLNGKGRPLSQADLIRNYFFMRLPPSEHERAYLDLWRPMQRRLGEESLTDFVRHYLTRFEGVIRETDVYAALKARVDDDHSRPPIAHLRELAQLSEYYAVLLKPELASTARIRVRLERLNRLEVTVAYPFLLVVFAAFSTGQRTEDEFCAILDTLENFVVRRFVCGVPTHGLNKVFAALYEQATRGGSTDLVAGVQRALSTSTRGYPKDEVFREMLGSARLYGGGDRREKTKLILERLEHSLGHKEVVVADGLTIEHVMPQTLSDDWKTSLGPSWEEDQDQLLHTLGNLTLTSYNAELSNSPFAEKKSLFATSHVELNRYFENVERWTAEEIERRSEVLTDLALSTWSYFGPAQAGTTEDAALGPGVTGKVPRVVRVREKEIPVQSWVEVAVVTMDAIAGIGDDEFARVVDEMPKFANRDATAFRRSSRLRKLANGGYVETNISASAIHRLCLQAVQLAGLDAADWSVEYAPAASDEDGDQGNEVSSQTKQLQLEFWTEIRRALALTNKFASLQTPRAQYWFSIALGRTGVHMSLTANTVAERVGVKIILSGDKAEQALELLLAQREAIEGALDLKLQWNPHPEKREKTIKVTHPASLQDRAAWPAAMAWLTKTAVAFHATFAPRIAQLDLNLG